MLVLALGACLAAIAAPAAADPAGARYRWRTSCERDFSSFRERAGSQASTDLYNGLLFSTVAGTLRFVGETNKRWSGVNSFDKEIQGAFRFGSSSQRVRSDTASDAWVAFQIAILPAASIGAFYSRTGDCVESYDMFTDAVESLGLALLFAESLKFATGRTRPFESRCDGGFPPSDSDCGTDSRFRSFVSGHATLAGTGAGLACAFAYKREAWGSGPFQKAMPCGLGIAGALTVGTLRVVADRHWATDVLVGLAGGALIGFFDTIGPFDLLTFERKDAAGRTAARGAVLPTAREGGFGLQLVMVY